jgi:hypothetical protein
MKRPLNKVIGGAFAGAVTIVLVWAVKQFASVEVPAEVASALTTIVSAAVAYLVPLSAREEQAIRRTSAPIRGEGQ